MSGSRFAGGPVAAVLTVGALLVPGVPATGAGMTPSPGPAVVHSSGVVAVPFTWQVDLDEGRLQTDGSGADLWLENAAPLYVVPQGASLAMGLRRGPYRSYIDYGRPELGLDGCLAALAAPIPDYGGPFHVKSATLPADTIPAAMLDDTSHLCVRTGEGRISEIWFAFPPSLGYQPATYILGYTTWEAPTSAAPSPAAAAGTPMDVTLGGRRDTWT